jgi:nucleoside-diphosphate-sugar epimerase
MVGDGTPLQDGTLLLVQTAQQDGVAPYIGAGANRHSTVHVDDLAVLYVLALERAPAGTLLNAAAGATVLMKELAMAVSYAMGRAGAIVSWTIDDACAALAGRANFFAMNHQISGARATLLLGWNPQAPSLLYDVAHGSYRIQLSG